MSLNSLVLMVKNLISLELVDSIFIKATLLSIDWYKFILNSGSVSS